MAEAPVQQGQYRRVEYQQFAAPVGEVRRALEGAAWLVLWPLARLCRRSDILFRTVSEALSLLPYAVGVVVRAGFYRGALRACGTNVIIEFGTVFMYPDVSLGSNVLIGRYNTIHHCDFGDYVLTAEGCAFLSGSRYHDVDRTDVPIALQGGEKKRISVGPDVWVGARATVMDDIASGAVVGAGAVVVEAVPPYAITLGVPARVRRYRRPEGAES